MLQDTFLPSLVAFLERYARAGPLSNTGADEVVRHPEDVPDALRRQALRSRTRSGAGTKRTASSCWARIGAVHANLKLHFDALYGRGWVAPPTLPQERPDRPGAGGHRSEIAAGADLRSPEARAHPGPAATSPSPRRPDPRRCSCSSGASGEPLTKGVAGLYTKDGYYKQFSNRADAAALQLADEESWVLGTKGGGLVGAANSPKVAEAVQATLPRRLPHDLAAVHRRHHGDPPDETCRGPSRSPGDSLGARTRHSSPHEGDRARGHAVGAPRERYRGSPARPSGKAREYAGKARRRHRYATRARSRRRWSTISSRTSGCSRAARRRRSRAGAVDMVVQQLNDLYQLLVAAKAALDAGQTLRRPIRRPRWSPRPSASPSPSARCSRVWRGWDKAGGGEDRREAEEAGSSGRSSSTRPAWLGAAGGGRAPAREKQAVEIRWREKKVEESRCRGRRSR